MADKPGYGVFQPDKKLNRMVRKKSKVFETSGALNHRTF